MRAFAVIVLFVACGPQNPPTEPLPESRPVEGAPRKKTTKRDPWASSETRAPERKPEPEADPPPPEPKRESSGGMADGFIAAHNRYRAKHCAPPLTWSKKLADVAQSWANQLKAKGCVFGHSPGARYGESLGAGTIGALDPESTVEMWYDEIKKYKWPNGGFSMETGHFTQLVWTTTKQVGCGHVQCKGNDIYVCEYDPPGNWEGQYRQHVLPASCKK